MPSIATVLALSLALGAHSVLASPISLPSVVRVESCSNADTDCWNRNALIFVNEYRATKGKGALISGPGPMLANALEHSGAMAAKGGYSLYHQDLKEAGKQVGCGLFVNRENVAMFGGEGKYKGKGASRQFMDGWIKSKGHRENIENAKAGDSVVVGVYIGGGKSYGTQVFASGKSTCGGSKTTVDPKTTAAPEAPMTTAAKPGKTNDKYKTPSKSNAKPGSDTYATPATPATTTAAQAGKTNDKYKTPSKSNAKPSSDTYATPATPATTTAAQAGTTTDAAGTTTDAAGTTTDAAGTTTDASGTTSDAAGTTSDAAGTTTDAAGTTTEAATTDGEEEGDEQTMTFKSWGAFLSWLKKASRDWDDEPETASKAKKM